MVLPIVTYGCEIWTMKKAEHWRIKAFELWYWRRRLRVPWTARRSNKSIPKKISPECSLEGLMLEAEAPILWPPEAKNWLNGKDWGQEEKRVTEDEMVGGHHWLNRYEFEEIPGDSEGQGILACCSPCGHRESDTTEQLNKSCLNLQADCLLRGDEEEVKDLKC